MQSNNHFWKGWSRWWHSITGFNLREKDYIYEYILFGFPGKSDNTIVANYCILYAKHYIYLEKLKNKSTNFNVDFLGSISFYTQSEFNYIYYTKLYLYFRPCDKLSYPIYIHQHFRSLALFSYII